MSVKVKTVEEYLEILPPDRRKNIEKVREVVVDNLQEGFHECIQYGMISYVIPFSTFSDTYNNKPLAFLSIGNQKNYISIYLNNIYSDPDLKNWFVEAYKATGKRLDMGKSCVRFKKLENLPLELIGEAVNKTSVEDFIKMYKHAKKTSR